MMTEQRRQELIADCEEEIKHLKAYITRLSRHGVDFDLSKYESELERQQIAIASLTAVPVAHIMGDDAIEDFNRGYEFFAVRGDASEECKLNILSLYTAPPVPVIKFPDDGSFDMWFKSIEAGDDDDWHEPEYMSKEWHEYIFRRQLALGAYRLAIDKIKRLNGLGE